MPTLPRLGEGPPDVIMPISLPCESSTFDPVRGKGPRPVYLIPHQR